MEDAIRLEATEDTPQIVLDKDNNHFEITGRSLPEDAPKFYKPVINWLKEYVNEPNDSTVLEMHLDYYNSASVKELIRILITLEEIKKAGKDVKVIWYYKESDELMEARGKEIKSMIDLPFELKAKKD